MTPVANSSCYINIVILSSDYFPRGVTTVTLMLNDLQSLLHLGTGSINKKLQNHMWIEFRGSYFTEEIKVNSFFFL